MSVPVASKRATRVLLVTNDFGPRAGGIETFIIGLLERIKGCEVLVYTSAQSDAVTYDKKWWKDFDIKIIRDRSRILLPTPRVISQLRRLIRDHQIEIIWFGAAAPLGISANWLRLPTVSRIIALTHGHEVWWAKLPPFSSLLRFSARQIDHFGFLGDFTGRQISKSVPKEKLVKVAPGIDTKHFRKRKTNLKKKLGISKQPVIISVGRLVHRKGQDRLLEALPLIRQEFPDIQLLMIGEGPHRTELEKIVRKLDLKANVKFLGRVHYEELPEYLSIADFFAMPARDRLFGLEVEGLGIVYLEAAACELPVLVGKSGGAPDAVIDGKTGFVVDGNSVAEIADKSLELLRSAKLRREFGKRARKFVIEEWRWEIWAKRFNQLLN